MLLTLWYCYKDILLLVEKKVIDSYLNIIEIYVNEMKENKIKFRLKEFLLFFSTLETICQMQDLKKKKTNSRII
jgi:hypothetical protein